MSGGKWCAADDGEESRKKKRGGRRREEEEEWKTGKKVHSISILLVLLPGYRTVLRSVNSYTDDMWVYHKRAHMSVNGGQKRALLANMMAVLGKVDLVTPTRWFSLLITCPICCSVYCHFTAKTS